MYQGSHQNNYGKEGHMFFFSPQRCCEARALCEQVEQQLQVLVVVVDVPQVAQHVLISHKGLLSLPQVGAVSEHHGAQFSKSCKGQPEDIVDCQHHV